MDAAIGIQGYITNSEGSGGIIKQNPDDFIVDEISSYPRPSYGKHAIVRLTSKNWETHHLIEKLAAILKIPPYLIGYAGIKDKRAVTSQLISLPVPLVKVTKIRLSDVTITPLYMSSKPVYKGTLQGNHFIIKIRDIQKNPSEIRGLMDEISSLAYFPNFFGIQRFGSIRPITHIVGKYILLNELEKAVFSYVANPLDGESKEAYHARKHIEDTHDFASSLTIYPKHLHYERRIIEYLTEHPENWKEALLMLPENLIRMFIHAYQSYLFNKILTRRIKNNISYYKAIIGDIIIPWDKGIITQAEDGISVNTNNIDKINNQILKYRCSPTGAIIGYNSVFAMGAMGDIEKAVHKEERLKDELFTLSHLPEHKATGMRRVIACPLKNIIWSFDNNILTLQFSLPKGCYATTILREIIKPDNSNALC